MAHFASPSIRCHASMFLWPNLPASSAAKVGARLHSRLSGRSTPAELLPWRPQPRFDFPAKSLGGRDPQQVLRLDRVVAQLTGFVPGEKNRPARLLGKPLEHSLHSYTLTTRSISRNSR